MKKSIVTFVLVFVSLVSFSQTANELYQRGKEAFRSSRDQEAVLLLQKAAEQGSKEACGLLGFMYYAGAVWGHCDGYNASKWAKQADVKQNLYASFTLGMIDFFKKDYDSAISLLENAIDGGMDITEARIALSISYFLNGNRNTAKYHALNVYNRQKDKEHKYIEYYTACALLSKMTYEEDPEDVNAMVYAQKTKDTSCPLGLYMMGRCQIEHNIFPSVGKQRIEEAANYHYNKDIKDVCAFSEIEKYIPDLLWQPDNVKLLTQNKYFALEPFKEEITKYYNKIKNKNYK